MLTGVAILGICECYFLSWVFHNTNQYIPCNIDMIWHVKGQYNDTFNVS